MVAEVIQAEVSDIESMIEAFREDEYDEPLGLGEMPLAIGETIHREAEDVVTLFQGQQLRETVAATVDMAFLMGRRFGQLEATTNIQQIAQAVPMNPTRHPSTLYLLRGE